MPIFTATIPINSARVCDDVTLYPLHLQAQFTFLHNGTGIIVGASVTLTLGDVAVANNNGSQHTALSQRFVVRFVKVNATAPAVQRSGNPGYVEGAPLLAGNCSSSYPLPVC